MKLLPEIPKYLQIKSYKQTIFKTNLVYEDDYFFTDRKEEFNINRNQIKKLLEKVFSNVNFFEYVYFTSGITHALDLILPQQLVQADSTEYRYVFSYNTVSTNQQKIRYHSFPNSANGKFIELSKDQEIILDCSYLFASNMKCEKYIPDNVQYLLIGFSKSHNIADIRVGCILSRKKIIGIHTLQYDYGYGDSIIGKILNNVEKFDLNYLYSINDPELNELYKSYNLLVGDTNLFAFSKNNQRIPYYVL